MTSSSNSLLTRTECSAMRGLAILCIALHNYFHWLVPAVKENEYTFSQHNVLRLLFEFEHHDWYSMTMHILSFFGHYGVPVFLFLSAYGLTKKYEGKGKRESNRVEGESGQGNEQGEKVQGANVQGSKSQRDESTFEFLWKHFKKLFIMMVPGLIAFIIIDLITPHPHTYSLINIIAQLGLFNNLLLGPDKVIWPGPYWFFGLMMQLYIVYRLLIYRRHWGFTMGLILVCWLAQCFLSPEGDALNYLRYNFVGSMLPFGLGVLYARYMENWLKLSGISYLTVCFVSLVAIFFGSLYYQSWFFVPVAVCCFSISFVRICPQIVNRGLAWIGGISSAIFVCHPITRKLFIHISKEGDIYTGALIYILATVLLAIVFHLINKWLNRKI